MAFEFDPAQYQTLLHFLLALGLGALIGIERERHRGEVQVLAGVRTYPIVSLGGAMAAYLATITGEPLLVSVGALVSGAFALLMYWVRQRLGTVGLTSPIALFATYFIGVLVGYGFTLEAILAGVAVTILLFTKERLHHLAKVMTPKEMEGALYFIVIAFILYPLTPAEPIDPWNLFNLRNFLLIVILVSLLSFLSFLAMRKYGSGRGLAYAGLLGGLVNSEAVAASLVQHAKKNPAVESNARHGILMATATMFLRNLAICAIADPSLDLLRRIWIPLVAASLILGAWTAAGAGGPPKEVRIQIESPFAFRPAFKFAFWFGLVNVATLILQRTPGLGDQAILVTALGGFVSAGAVTASMASLVASGHAPLATAALTTVLASLLAASNKFFIARVASSPLANRLLPALLLSIAAAGLLFWVVPSP